MNIDDAFKQFLEPQSGALTDRQKFWRAFKAGADWALTSVREHIEPGAPTPPTEDELADALESLQVEKIINVQVGKALNELKGAAQGVVDCYLREPKINEDLDDAVATLAEVIPCDDCLSAPCRCPND